MKNRGIKIAVLYTTYLAAADQPLVQYLDLALQPALTVPLRTARSRRYAELRLAGILFRGQPEPGHFGGHDELFKKAVADARISS